MANQVTKFEVLNFTRSGNMKDVAKCTKWGGLGWLGSPKVNENSAIPYSAYEFLLAFHSRPYLCPYLAPFLRYSDISVENRRFEPTPLLFGAPVGGDIV